MGVASTAGQSAAPLRAPRQGAQPHLRLSRAGPGAAGAAGAAGGGPVVGGVAPLARTAMQRMTLAGGEGHTLLAECPGALLQFFDTPGACALRLVCREFQAAVAAHPWEDRETVILGSIGAWRACFQRARCANVCTGMTIFGGPVVRRTPVVDADFVHFVGLWELDMSGCKAVTDAAFVHLRGIRVLDMTSCDQPTVTDAGLAHLVGIQKLSIWGCSQATLTDAAFAPLRGIRVLNMSWCHQLTYAAFVHLKGIHTLIMWWCNQPTITDAALAHLKGIKCLVLWECSIPFTEVGLAHLRGITRLHMGLANAASVAAARDLGLPATKGADTEYSAFRYSDSESGPWPAGAEWK